MSRGKRVILERAIPILLLFGVISLQLYIYWNPQKGSVGIPTHLLLTPSPTGFSFTTITLKNGQVLPNVLPVSIPVAQLPLTITGTYSTKGSGQVWVVVRDNAGSYYLQQPQVEFRSGGQWIAHNVNTNVGTTEIDFVSVTSLGQSIFSFMVQAKAFDGFAQLPDGSQIVQDISIQVTPPPTLTPSVLITAPTDGSKVLISTTVQGTASNIPKDEELWLFIVPSDQTSYFPQPGPIAILGEQWSINARFGDANNVGLKYTLIPVLINQNDKDAHDAIQTYFRQQPPGPYKGIQLTSGMQLLQPEVTVIHE